MIETQVEFKYLDQLELEIVQLINFTKSISSYDHNDTAKGVVLAYNDVLKMIDHLKYFVTQSEEDSNRDFKEAQKVSVYDTFFSILQKYGDESPVSIAASVLMENHRIIGDSNLDHFLQALDITMEHLNSIIEQ